MDCVCIILFSIKHYNHGFVVFASIFLDLGAFKDSNMWLVLV